MTKQLNVRVPKITKQQIKNLQRWTGMTQTQIVMMALDRRHQECKQEQSKS